MYPLIDNGISLLILLFEFFLQKIIRFMDLK